jgi:hypothetical protein
LFIHIVWVFCKSFSKAWILLVMIILAFAICWLALRWQLSATCSLMWGGILLLTSA